MHITGCNFCVQALSRLGGHLNMNLVTPMEYRDKFVEAEAMFMHQPVFDPIKRCIVPLDVYKRQPEG